MKTNRTILFLVGLSLLVLPTFFRMLQPGLYSMQDFPYFRVVQYSKCLSDFQLPCRWAPDAALGYGEPVFSFYSHVPFFISALLSQIGFSYQIALKSVFAFSLLGSALSMYLLAKRIWKNEWSAILCALLYVYAPYRAVNVWVRGAFPEAFAFVVIPLILLSFELFLDKKSRINLSFFAGSISLLILTHNLSVILYAPLIVSWILVRLIQTKSTKFIPHVIIGGIVSLGLSAFYLLPTIFESRFVTIAETTRGYFDFRAHFVTFPQLFLSRFWGYGGSTWGNEDGLSLSIGHVQWSLALLVIIFSVFYIIRKKKSSEELNLSIYLVILGFVYLLFTHNKSAFIWEALSPISSFIQFPWRFLGPALFVFSLACGFLIKNLPKKIYVTFLVFAVLFVTNATFFKEDIWFHQSDEYFLTGERWQISQVASIGDYWTSYGPIPRGDETFSGITSVSKKSDSERFTYSNLDSNQISFPIMYFPGWTAYESGGPLPVSYDERGFVMVTPQSTSGEMEFVLEDTNARAYANTISLLTFIVLLCVIKYDRYIEKNNKA